MRGERVWKVTWSVLKKREPGPAGWHAEVSDYAPNVQDEVSTMAPQTGSMPVLVWPLRTMVYGPAGSTG
jgi:hypothetical protein